MQPLVPSPLAYRIGAPGELDPMQPVARRTPAQLVCSTMTFFADIVCSIEDGLHFGPVNHGPGL
jgi:hypothetical protein